MGLFLSHTSALWALREWRNRRHLAEGERCSLPVPSGLPDAAELTALLASASVYVPADQPIELLVSSGRAGRVVRGARVHVCRVPMPPDSAVRLSKGVACAAPELVAVQMASSLTDLELCVLLAELMGLYAICPTMEGGMFQRDEPLTTPEALLAYLNALGKRCGVARVRRALARTCVRSGSPRETKLALRLSLKPALGGYGLSVVAMNEPVAVQRLGRQLSMVVRKPDLLIGRPGEGIGVDVSRLVAVEYSGWRHADPYRAALDAVRSNELKAGEISEYTIWKDQYDDQDYMDDLVSHIRCDLGLAKQRLTMEMKAKRRRLRQRLYEELESIDGVHWNGRRNRYDRVIRSEDGEEPGSDWDFDWDVVPADVYGC